MLDMTESYRQPVVETRYRISWRSIPYRERSPWELPGATSIEFWTERALHTLGGLGLRGLIRHQRA
jgi:hypothetical protein